MDRNTISDAATVDSLRHVLRALIIGIFAAEGSHRAVTNLDEKVGLIALAGRHSGGAICTFGGSNPLFN